MQSDFLIFNSKKIYSKLLDILFFISFLSILLSILSFGLLNVNIIFYELSYYLIVIIPLLAFFNNYYQILKLNQYLFWLLIYFLFVTLPITFFVGNISSSFIFFKNFMLFIPLSIFFMIVFKNISDILPFIKKIIYAGVFVSFYLIFEFFNKIFNFFPLLNSWINNYIVYINRTEFFVYTNTESFDIISLIRPMGLDINFTSGAFFIAASLIFIIISGNRFIMNIKLKYFFFLIMYLALFVSSSRQIIFYFHFSLLLALILTFSKKNNFDIKTVNSIRKSIVIFSVFILILFSFLITKYYVYIYNIIDVFNFSGTGTVGLIINDLYNLNSGLSTFFNDYPFNFFFGIGTYTPNLSGLYYMLPHFKELHFFIDTFYTFGLFGFIFFWFLFLNSLNHFYRKILKNPKSKYSDLFLSMFLITLIFILSIFHYSPIGLSTNFIVALIPFFYIKSI